METKLDRYKITWIENGQKYEKHFESFEKAAEFAGNLPEAATKIRHFKED